ncbi:adenylate/guanylate cyclase domain-containing protein [Mesorhizobium sp. BAC0120]|nr:adenylate/guanylate cyclase domain-containing protein [Mesorhizobium sp. BAC0120]MDW6025616.1 adenylate/guanylate cyclase domain-containing protein [Mesorhizobium sp. BAC0120]
MAIAAESVERINSWIVIRGLAGDDEITLLDGVCEYCCEAGLSLSRAVAIIDTLDPVYEGRVFSWRRDKELENPVSAYEPTREGPAAEAWRKSPFFYLWSTGRSELRFRLEQGETGDLVEQGETGSFEAVEELRAEGQTDYLALIFRFGKETVIGEMDSFMARWVTDQPGGFDEADVAALRRLTAALGLAIKSRSLARVAQSLVEAYLGRDAGRRVLEGRIRRGTTKSINAVLWFSDMQGFTAISEKLPSDQLIPLLDDYAEAVISAIHGAGGDVLKLIGDGVLAIFAAGGSATAACRSALAAERDMRSRLAALEQRRAAAGAPVASIYLGLHIGDVFYGNIGAKNRLDFTVVGPAVNETHRISSMCSSVGRNFLLSSDFLQWLSPDERQDFVSVGRFALRGVSRAQELFTLDPEIAGT